MPIPESEVEFNERKTLTDRAVGLFLGMDRRMARQTAEEAIIRLKPPYKIVVCGGSGSFKTTFSEELSKILEVPAFDLDLYIPGGWTENQKQYQQSFAEGLNNLWDDIPLQKEWIIEHVEACGQEVRDLFKPKWAIHLHPGMSQLTAIARLRDAAAGEAVGSREVRAMSSGKLSSMQFKKAPGKVVAEGYSWMLKELS